MTNPFGRSAAQALVAGIGRRDFVRAAALIGAGTGVAGVAAACSHDAAPPASNAAAAEPITVLQPGQGDTPGDHYLQSTPDQVLWGYVPNVHATPVMQMQSGQTVTIDGDIVDIDKARESAVYTFDPIKVRCDENNVIRWQHDKTSKDRFIFHVKDVNKYPSAMTKAMKSLLMKLP